MKLSKIANEIKESPTLAMNDKARVLREKGEKVIHLGSGEPKSKVPSDAIEAAKNKLDTGTIRYTPTEGIGTMIKAIGDYTKENYGREVAAENIIVSNGAKHSLYNLLIALLDPGDEVICIVPYWVSYPEIIKMMHATPVIVSPPEGSFEPDLKTITDAIKENTKAIIVNSPNNPAGVVYSEELIAALVRHCEENDIFLIMDDIYQKLVFDGKTVPSALKHAKENFDDSHLIIVNGVSKLYAMTGFRIGWAVAARKIIQAMTNIQVQNISCVSVVTQEAAVGALSGDQSGVGDLITNLEENRDFMLQELKSIPGVTCIKPKGTFYCLPDFRKFNPDSVALSNFLLEKVLVVTVPGYEFGLEGHIRLSYCGSKEEIKEGINRIRWALDKNATDDYLIGDRKIVKDW